MKIMVLGHKDHGKTTVAEILKGRFSFSFEDTTQKVVNITREYIKNNPTLNNSEREILFRKLQDKNRVRPLMKEALRHYTRDDPARLIKEQFVNCDVYAGCRSSTEYEAAKDIIDFTFWIQDPRKEENDPTMDIVFDPNTMIHINNNGSLLQLEHNLKYVLYRLAGIPIYSHDVTLRDSIVSNMGNTLIPNNNR